MNIRLFFCFFLLQFAFCLPQTSWAFLSQKDKGTSSAEFLKLGVGGRACGMGEAFSAVADDSSAIYWNPAGLARIKGRSAMFMHAALFEGISYEFLGYGQRVKDIGAFGIGIQYLSVGIIQETDSSGSEIGSSFSPKDMAISAAYSMTTQGFSFGASAKYIHSKIIKSASTVALDFGVLSPKILQENLMLSFVVQNLGGKLKFDRESDPLPFNIKFGSALSLEKNCTLALDLNLPRDNRPYVALGTEYRIPYGPDWRFSGRLGFNSKTLSDVSGFTGFSFGIGAGVRRFQLDYAFVPFGTIGLTHRVSLALNF